VLIADRKALSSLAAAALFSSLKVSR